MLNIKRIININKKTGFLSLLLIIALILCTMLISGGCSFIKGSKEYDYIVAKDGSGDFTTIQEAINKVPLNNTKRVKIFIKNGVYDDGQIFIDHFKPYITLIGESRDGVKLTGSMDTFYGFGTSGSATLNARGEGFAMENLTVENTSLDGLAVYLAADKSIVKNVNILGTKNVLFLSNNSLYTKFGWQSRQYFENCLIKGNEDIVYGPTRAVFNKCEIWSNTNEGAIISTNTPKEADKGFVFIECKLESDGEENSTYLGRQWSDEAAIAFINTTIGAHIKTDGWFWKGKSNKESARFFEYKSQGSGAAINENRAQLTDEEAKEYTVENVFKGEDISWNPLEEKY